MKGIVFNLLEEAIDEAYGLEVWEDLLVTAGVDGAYTSLGNYDDTEFRALLGTASDELHVSVPELLTWFGRRAMGGFQKRYPNFFTPHEATIPFLLTLNDIIHPEVRKLYPGADVPNFTFDLPDERTIVIHYMSEKRLCHFAHGLIFGAADHYEEEVAIHEDVCMLKGDEACLIVCRFGNGGRIPEKPEGNVG